MRLTEEHGRRQAPPRIGLRERAGQLGDERAHASIIAVRPPLQSMPVAPARMVHALQRAAGNRAVTQLVRVQRAPLDVQRCGAHGCAGRDQEAPEDKGAASQGVIGQEEEYPPPGQLAAQRLPAGASRWLRACPWAW